MSTTPLYKKLGIKSDIRIHVNNEPSNYIDLLEWNGDPLHIHKNDAGELDFVHLFSTNESDLIFQIESCLPYLKKTAMLWISWPKKSSNISTSIDKWDVMRIGQESGLVDVKICSIDDNWSAHKFVYRLNDR